MPVDAVFRPLPSRLTRAVIRVSRVLRSTVAMRPLAWGSLAFDFALVLAIVLRSLQAALEQERGRAASGAS